MNRRRLLSATLGLGALLVSWRPAAAGSAYGIKSSKVMYLPQEPFHVTDERYAAMTDFETRTVEVHQPTQAGQPLVDRPVILFVHGGGWVDEYASWYNRAVTPALVAQQGWVVVNVDYRLTSNRVYLAATYPTVKTKAAWHPDNVRDVAAALDWTVRHIEGYGGDPRNIFPFGHSAGAHLVSLLATHPDFRALRPFMRGVISLSGMYDLHHLSPWMFNSLFDQTFRGGHTDDAGLDEASPLTYVTAGEILPPFYVLHCQNDLPYFAEQAIAFRNRLETHGDEVQGEGLPGYDHVSEIWALADGQQVVTQAIVAYVETHIREASFFPLMA